jgi:serine phosphatase RsbU (regulator of sigma subunit)
MANTFPHLTVRDASGNDREVVISRTPFNLGRHSDNDLVLLDSRISRRHARIVSDERGYVLEDAGSRHGTFVNGERIETSPLKSGDQISLGVIDSYQICFATEQSVIPSLLEKFGKTGEVTAPVATQQLQHLGLLLQMAQILNSAPALEEVLVTLVDSALQLTDAERGLLFLRAERDESPGTTPATGLHLRLGRGRDGVNLGSQLEDYSRAAVERVASTGREEVVIEDLMTGRTAQETGIIGKGMRGVLAVPLQKLPMMELSRGETMRQAAPELLGVLYLDSRSRATSLTSLDRQVLQTLALEGATVIENTRLFRITREQERIQHELSLARNIQQGLLPSKLPQSGFFEVATMTMPSRTVGGDYYDVITLPGDRFGITVADVSGKGLPAAMMAATMQGAFAAVAAGAPDLEELFRRINDFLCERTPSEMYATMFYGVLNRAGRFAFVSAGHPPSLLLRASGTVEQLDSSNFPMGLFPNVTFGVENTRLETGDSLLVYSDGVTESQNALGELFGEERLVEQIKGKSNLRPQELSAGVMAAVNDFVGAAPQADDLTLIVVRFGGT